MKSVYINSVGAISAQKSFDNSEFLAEIVSYDNTVIPAVNPNYKDYIPPAAARRMAKGIKMGVVASKIALQEAGLETVDAVITGTGMGCVRDSEKFVSTLIDNDEQYLTPTSFIQSTHNTVAAQIALGLKCKGYNFTYVHGSNSFESALVDASMQLELDEAEHILVGGVDELGTHTVAIHKLIHHIKAEVADSLAVFSSETKGAIFSEGANFFVLSNQKESHSYAVVKGISMYNTLAKSDVKEKMVSFLKEHGRTVDQVDVLITGRNGDVEFDPYYDALALEMATRTLEVGYKHLCGEFNTASSFGFWMGAKMLKTQEIPKVVRWNGASTSEISTILLYNQYRGENHSFVLLEKC